MVQEGFETTSRNTQRASARPIHSYEKRPRRKTKADRYEPYKGASVSEKGSPRLEHSQKKAILMKQNNSRVAEKFRAKNIKTGRLTLTSNEHLGIFKKGKTSSPISSVKVSYPKFSELQFLAKQRQPAVSEEEVHALSCLEKHDESTSDALIERELFQVLADCRKLSVHYDEYVPRFPNSRFVSLEDLKGLCKDLDNIRPERREMDAFEHATDNDSHGVRHASFCWTRTEDAYLSTPENNAAKKSAQQEEMFDMLLDSVEDFDEDVALEVLAELVEPGTDRYELQPPDHTYYAHDMEALTPNYSYDVPRTLEEDCGGFTMGYGENSAISSTTQRRYDDTMIPIGRYTRAYCDMKKEATVNTPEFGNSSALDDRQFQFLHGPTPTLSATHIPVHAAVQNQQTLTTSRRPFWRRNKLY